MVGPRACDAAAGTMPFMTSATRVCPFCGEPPGAGVFCAACGRSLAAVDRLPTRAEWEASDGSDARDAPIAAAEPSTVAPTAAPTRPLDDRCAEATAAFLDAMRAAGCPGTGKWPMPEAAKQGFLRRTPEAHGWAVRAVVWDDPDAPKHYDAGIVLTTGGAFHPLESQIRGWGQRDFPRFHDTVGAAPVAMPVEERLIADLEALLREHGVGGRRPA
jgi:hypothetical protein